MPDDPRRAGWERQLIGKLKMGAVDAEALSELCSAGSDRAAIADGCHADSREIRLGLQQIIQVRQS